MRNIVAATFLVFAAGCAAQGLPLDEPGAGGNGGAGGGGSRAVDMARALGGTGATCRTACDCQPGLACRMGTCGMSNIGPIFCCDDTASCPAGSFCQSSMGGFAQCGSSSGGSGGTGGGGGFGGGPGGGGGGGSGGFPGTDLGIGMFCGQIPCATSAGICKMIGCGACTAAGTCGTN